MGLDMYLYGNQFIGANFDHREVKAKCDIWIGKRQLAIDTSKLSEMVFHLAYWRKASHIHNWFVVNCQSGKDDCGKYYVSAEQLEELSGLCQAILDKKEANGQWRKLAEELMPVQGFFFGTVELDEWYFHNLQETIDQFKTIPVDGTYDFYYQSSW